MALKINLLLILLVGSLNYGAQITMKIYQSDGSLIQIPLSSIDSIIYENNQDNLPIVLTNFFTEYTNTSVKLSGHVVDAGASPLVEAGFVWSTSPNQTLSDFSVVAAVSINGGMLSEITGLTPNTHYYFKAYATNMHGTAYGVQLEFHTLGDLVTSPGNGVNFDNFFYPSIVLGNGQEWMSENLRTNIYENGDSIPNVTDAIEWDTLITGAWSHYDNNIEYENPYGKLYNWFTTIDTRNVCPSGWHVPTDEEWGDLINYIDPNADGGNFQNIAGSKLKKIDDQLWFSYNYDATNETGFSGIPGGSNAGVLGFIAIGQGAYYWSSSENIENGYGWERMLDYMESTALRTNMHKTSGLSIRCLKD